MIECKHVKTPEQFNHVLKLNQLHLEEKGWNSHDTMRYFGPLFEKAGQGGPDHFFISYENAESVAYLHVRTHSENRMGLIFAFTRFDSRNRGHFQELLRTALKTLKPEHVTYDILPEATFDASESIEKILEDYHAKK